MMKNVKSEYCEFFKKPENIARFNEFKKIVYGPNDTLIHNLFDIVAKDINTDHLRIADIGGSDGMRLRELIDLFRQNGKIVDALLIEQSEEAVKQSKSASKGYNIESIASRFEDYRPIGLFDWISFIHSIYTFTDDTYLQSVKNMATPGGIVSFVVNAPDTFLGNLKSIFDVEGKRYEPEDLEKGLKNNGISYDVVASDTYFQRLTKEGKLTKEGVLMLEWMSLSPLDKMKPETRDKAINFVLHHKTPILERDLIYICRL